MTATRTVNKAVQGLEYAFNLLRSGKQGEAVRKCRGIAKANSGRAEILRLCSQMAQQCGKPDFALRWIQQAILAGGVGPEYHFAKGRICLQRLRVQEAIASFEKVLSKAPDDAPAYLQLGLCYIQNGDYQKAITHLQQSIRKDPGLAAAYYWMGSIYSRRENESTGDRLL